MVVVFKWEDSQPEVRVKLLAEAEVSGMHPPELLQTAMEVCSQRMEGGLRNGVQRQEEMAFKVASGLQTH